MSQIEVEQKFPLASTEALHRALAPWQVRFSEPELQVDRYFNHPARDFAQTDEAFRIRSIGEQNFVTYKGPKLDAETKTRWEIEIAVASGADEAERFAQLLLALGFREAGTVKKHRRHAQLAWQGTTVDLMLDQVAGLGEFLELEIVCDKSGVSQARDCLQSLASELPLQGSERRSYLELLRAK